MEKSTETPVVQNVENLSCSETSSSFFSIHPESMEEILASIRQIVYPESSEKIKDVGEKHILSEKSCSKPSVPQGSKDFEPRKDFEPENCGGNWDGEKSVAPHPAAMSNPAISNPAMSNPAVSNPAVSQPPGCSLLNRAEHSVQEGSAPPEQRGAEKWENSEGLAGLFPPEALDLLLQNVFQGLVPSFEGRGDRVPQQPSSAPMTKNCSGQDSTSDVAFSDKENAKVASWEQALPLRSHAGFSSSGLGSSDSHLSNLGHDLQASQPRQNSHIAHLLSAFEQKIQSMGSHSLPEKDKIPGGNTGKPCEKTAPSPPSLSLEDWFTRVIGPLVVQKLVEEYQGALLHAAKAQLSECLPTLLSHWLQINLPSVVSSSIDKRLKEIESAINFP